MGLVDGRKIVAAAGTAERLSATSTGFRSVTIVAETDNTQIVVVGGSTVVAALLTRRGVPLSPGDVVSLTEEDGEDDLRDIWLDAMVSGEGVTYIAGVT